MFKSEGFRFFAQGAFYQVTGDCVSISKSSISNAVQAVTNGLAARKQEFIRFLNTKESIRSTKRKIYSIKELPNVIDAIDCTHVEILAPKLDIKADHVNQKGRH